MAGKHGCTGHKHGGADCDAWPVRGTDRCPTHAGVPREKHKAKGAVVVELRNWGLTQTELRDPGEQLLRLVAQSSARAELYASLLQEAYEAAERLRHAGQAGGRLPPHADNETDEHRAIEDLDRVFSTGGVAALIGVKWGAAGKDGHLYQAEEAIRGLVALESDERDRCARFCKIAVDAKIAERQVRLAEEQARTVVELIRGALSELGHDPADPLVARVVSTRMKVLAGVA